MQILRGAMYHTQARLVNFQYLAPMVLRSLFFDYHTTTPQIPLRYGLRRRYKRCPIGELMDVIDHRQLGGLAVRRVANRLTRFFHIEANLMRVIGGWTPRTTSSATRMKWGRHLNQDARHADALRQRLSRLRTTPEMIHLPCEAFREIFERANEAASEAHFFGAIYLAIKPRLVCAYQTQLSQTDRIGDELTSQMLQSILAEEREHILWGEQALSALIGCDAPLKASVLTLVDSLKQAIDETGFLYDSDEVPDDRQDEEASLGTGFWMMRRKSAAVMKMGAEYRVAQVGEEVSHCPKYEEFGVPEKQVMLVHHGLMPEHASLALVGNMLYEFPLMPWEFYLDFATQAGDEERHIMLLLKRLEELGGGTDSFAFPEWTFYDLLAGLSLSDRIAVFNAIVEGDVVENLHERIKMIHEVGDHRTAHIMDWICADESLHMMNGMRWLAYLHGEDDATMDRVLDEGQKQLAEVLGRVKSSEKSYDSAAEISPEERKKILERRRATTFYHKRNSPVAPIARKLGGFKEKQIDRLVDLADGKTNRL
jgi:bacterioferritin (cytochrome b1)